MNMNKDLIEKRVQEAVSAASYAVSDLNTIVTDDFFTVIKLISKRKGKILVTGVGKSGFIAMKMSATLVSLGHQSYFLNPLDALHGDSGMISNGDVLIAFSFSGASSELVRLIKHCQEHFSIKVVTITGNKNSQLAKLSHGAISFSIESEGCPLGLAPMASTTASLVVADSIAAGITSPEVFKKEQFAKFHPAGSLGLSLRKVEEVMRSGKRLPIVAEDASFEDVLRVITFQKLAQMVGVVNHSGFLIGGVGDGDVRRMLIKHGDLRTKPVQVIMNKRPKTIDSQESLQVALDTMRVHKINSLFVVDETNLYIGFIHIHDIVGG